MSADTLDDTGPFNRPLLLTTVLLLTAVAVAAVGWVEDLAAHRAPALWPLPRRDAGQAPASPEPATVAGRYADREGSPRPSSR